MTPTLAQPQALRTRRPLTPGWRWYGDDVKVLRIVANVSVAKTSAAREFYETILGLDVQMDLGWIATYASPETMPVQISFLTEGGSGAPAPDLSIEVDDFEEVLARVERACLAIVYGPVEEPWGVRRFFVRDPFGKLVNLLAHTR